MMQSELLKLIISKGRISDDDWPVAPGEPWDKHLKCYDQLAAELATRYDLGAYTFEEADGAANQLWIDMLNRLPTQSSKISDLLYEVYDAFDAGEWDYPGEYDDPVSQLTNPLIKEILAKL